MGDMILVLDLGTSRLKSTLFSLEGKVLACESASYPTDAPCPTWAEQDPAVWWSATVRATRAALATIGYDRDHSRGSIVGIGVTGQMHGLVLLDGSGAPLGSCLTLQDMRAVPEADAIDRDLGAGRVYSITGARLDAASPAAKLRWLSRHRPELIARTAAVLSPKDYVRYLLTGHLATDPVDAAGTLLYDLRERRWSGEIAAAAGVPLQHLPPILPSHHLAGELSRDAAAALSLSRGIPVAVGAGDDVECLGADLIAPGHALEHLGSTGSILACTPSIVIDPAMRVDCYPHAVPDLYLVGGSTSSAGAALAWAARNLVAVTGSQDSGASTNSLFFGDQLPAPNGSDPIFLPYLAGERCPLWDPDARGLLAGLTLRTTHQQIVRAIFAGVAFSLRHVLDTLLELGLQIGEIVTSGNDQELAGSAWPVLRSTLYGRPLLMPEGGDPTALGTLILTLVAIGRESDPVTATTAVVPRPMERVEPEESSRAALEHRYQLYRTVAGACADLFSPA
ncbi:MAG: hypothetical protein JOZ41_15870 [Chloroflexi bacterium]|nr:hypothetical protein [Chloroflexota bacterium]